MKKPALPFLTLLLTTTAGLAADATHVLSAIKLGDESIPTSVTKLGEKNITSRKTTVGDPNLQPTQHSSGWDIIIAPHTTTDGTIQANVTARQTHPATQDKSQAAPITTSTAITYTFTLPADQRDHTLKLGATPVTFRLTPTTASGEPAAR